MADPRLTRPGDPGWRPAHAYVPGQTPRHAEGLFDPIRDTARPGHGAEALRRSLAWTEGLAYLREGYFWEAHELHEAIWLILPDSPARQRVQSVIQLANAGLKQRMNRPRAARRLSGIAWIARARLSATLRMSRAKPVAA